MKREVKDLVKVGDVSITEELANTLETYVGQWDDLVDKIEIADKKIVAAFGQQAMIIYNIEEKHGKDAMKAFCSMIGITDRHVRRYRQAYRLIGMGVLEKVSARQAKELLEGLDAGTIEITGNSIRFYADGTEMSIDTETMSLTQFADFIGTMKSIKNRLQASEKEVEKIREYHEREMDTVINENKKLRGLLLTARMEGSVSFNQVKEAMDPVLSGLAELILRVGTLDDPQEKIEVAKMSNNLIAVAQRMRTAVGFLETSDGPVWVPEMMESHPN